MTYFAFCIHNHQPAGNFDGVLEEAYQKSYWPFLKTLSKYPAIKLTLHTSGYLLDWLVWNHPEYIDLMKSMVFSGQVELLGGGYYEPVLAVIPEDDREAQIKMMSDRLHDLFGKRPRGIWLAERVWEPNLPSSLRKAGVEYLIVDDYHFIKAGLEKEDLGGYYMTEDQGYPVKVFPGGETLRYLIPFKPIERLEEHLRGLKGFLRKGSAAIYGDDGEKFGVWPGTHKWVYDDGWLEMFFKKIEAWSLEWLKPVTLSEFSDAEGPLGRVYLPATSYMEMGEWSLPAPASKAFEGLLEEMKHWGEQGERIKRFMQGGTWRNFFAKYPEANWMHKRMLLVSRALKERTASGGEEGVLVKAARLLYSGQCNDAYWHGIFGGLYLPHLRTKVYESLISAENLFSAMPPAVSYPSVSTCDVDADGRDEIILGTEDLTLFLSPSGGGSLYELDFKPRSVNLSNTLSRWPEGYHHRLKERVSGAGGAGAAQSIHDLVLVKEEGLENHLKFDAFRRASFIDRFIGADETLEAFSSNQHKDLADFHLSPYEAEVRKKDPGGPSVILSRRGVAQGGRAAVAKEIRASGGNSFSVAYSVDAPAFFGERFGVELNLLLPCCSGPACFYHFYAADKIDDAGLASSGELLNVGKLSLVDKYSGVILTVEAAPGATLWRFPIYTVSLSEAGFEKIYQGSCLLFLFPIGQNGRLDAAFSVKAEGFA